MSERADNSTDIQDPLPESNWFWRRVFTFAVTAVILFFMWGLVDRIGKVAVVAPSDGIPALLSVSKWMIVLCWFAITYYLLAPSAEQVTKMFKTATLLRSGVQMAASRVVREPGRTVEEAATVAQPPQPAIPAPGAPIQAPEAPEAVEAPQAAPGPSPAASEVTSKGKPTEILE